MYHIGKNQKALIIHSLWVCEETGTHILCQVLSCIGEGNGNPLQCSCLENPRGGGAWWAAVYEVAQSRTRLKGLSSSSSSTSLMEGNLAYLTKLLMCLLFELWCWRRLLRVPWTARRSASPFWRRSALGFLRREWCWSWNSGILATLCEELTHWQRLWCWEGLGAGGEGDDRGRDGWMASLTRWMWVCLNFGSWWWTGRPGVLRFIGLQRVGHDWATDLIWWHG